MPVYEKEGRATVSGTTQTRLNEPETNKVADPLVDGDQTRETTAKPTWKHWSFRWWFIAIPLAVHVAQLVALVIILARWSKHRSFLTLNPLHTGSYFAWIYLPLVTTVAASFFWEVLDLNVRRLEVFHALTQPGGASLRDSLNLDYVTAFSYFLPYQSASRRHWAVTLSSVSYILEFSVLPILASAVWKLSPDEFRLEIRIAFVGLAIVALVAIIGLGITLIIVLHRRTYGLYSDPTSIGGLASLISGSNLLPVFRSLRSYDSQESIDKRLATGRFALIHSDTHDYQIQLIDDTHTPLSTPPTHFQQSRREAHSWWLWGRSYILLTVITWIPNTYIWLAFGGVIPLNSYAATPAFSFLSIINTAILSNWQHHVATLEPYYQMTPYRTAKTGRTRYCHWRDGKNALSLSFMNSPVVAMVQAMIPGKSSSIVGFISFTALLMQIHVALNPIDTAITRRLIQRAYGDDLEVRLTYNDSVSQAVLYFLAAVQVLFTFIGLIVMMLRRRRPFMPRKPWTVASTILYLCHSEGLLEDVSGTSMMGKQEREAVLRGRGGRYRFGWFKRPTGTASGSEEEDENTTEWVVGINRAENVTLPYVYGQTRPEWTGDEREEESWNPDIPLTDSPRHVEYNERPDDRHINFHEVPEVPEHLRARLEMELRRSQGNY